MNRLGTIHFVLANLIALFFHTTALATEELSSTLRVGAAAINLKCDDSMVISGGIRPRYVKGQEGELRSVAVVVEIPGRRKIAIVACDVLWIPRDIVDSALVEIEKMIGLSYNDVLVNATHTHHAPSTSPAHDFGVSLEFCKVLKHGIIKSVIEANRNLSQEDCNLFFHLGEESTVGANSRLKLPDGNITWVNALREAGDNIVPTGPYDPQLPVLDFRDDQDKSVAILFNHSTHTIGTRRQNVRSPSFYGLAAQELEAETGATVSFLEGASGSTHNITGVPVAEAVIRIKDAVKKARSQAKPHVVDRLASIRRPFRFKVRSFDEGEEDLKITRYTAKYMPESSDYVREVFAAMREKLKHEQGKEKETWVQAMLIGDIALVGVPAEYFTSLGMDIKKRSPFKHTYVAELANDHIGYQPDRKAHRLGGYQTWMGLHSYAEPGTGERMADAVVDILNELSAQKSKAPKPQTKSTDDAAKHSTPPRGRPNTPKEESQGFHLSNPEHVVEMVACEPDVISPVAISWDADGRMYVAEMIGYPASAGVGRLRRLEDSDGDGRYETATIFADQLSFPTSVMPYRDGVLVATAPDILFLRDTDGDGRADERRVEWTGFNADSQQLRANALHWGIDNWIYGANGRCDGEIRPGQASAAKPVSIRTRDFRFRPKENRFEAIAGQSQFGQAHDDRGNRFLSWNTVLARHVAVPDEYVGLSSALASVAVVDMTPSDDLGEVFPISPPPIQFNSERANSFNALCGLTIYRGNALGETYEGNLFVAESLTNLVTRRKLSPKGPTFVAERAEAEKEFLAAEDPWFHPVFLTTGPDGALYVVDFYREFVEHPRYVASQEIRERVDWRNGFTHGRIWRIRRKNSELASITPRLSEAPTTLLVDHLKHPIGWWRDTAHRLLVQRQDQKAIEPLKELLFTAESPVARLHALWVLEGLGNLDEEVVYRGLADEDAGVREHTLRLSEPFINQSPQLQRRMTSLVADPSKRVLFQLALSASAISDAGARIALLSRLIVESAGDPWMAHAVLFSAGTDVHQLLILVRANGSTWLEDPSEWQLKFLLQVAEAIGEIGFAKNSIAVLNTCVGSDDPSAIIKPRGQLAIVCGLTRGAAKKENSLADLWNEQNESTLDKVCTACEAVAINADECVTLRQAAIEMLRLSSSDHVDDTLIELLDEAHPAEVQEIAAESAVAFENAKLASRLFLNWNQRSSRTRRLILKASLGSATGVVALLDAIQGNEVSVHEIPIEIERQLKRNSDPALSGRIAELLRSKVQSDRGEVIAEYGKALKLSSNVLHGAAVFSKHCLTCHSIQRFGSQIGPDLTGFSARPSESVMADILDPNRQVSADNLAYHCLTLDGKSIVGLIVAETPESVILCTADDKQFTIPTTEIDELVASGTSLMPEGFEKKLSQQDMADLLAFLRQPRRQLLELVE